VKRPFAALVASAALALVFACSTQGEGERCDSTEDCNSGLECTSRTSLSTAGVRVCCPAGSSASTSDICRAGGTDLSDPDASTPVIDAATPAPDAETPVPDAETPDAETPAPDAETPIPDAGTPVGDSGADASDGQAN
jgi:hypothetical protein